MTAELFGYLALSLGILAMGMKRLVLLRSIHALSALAYIVYGTLIEAYPIIVGGSFFIIIHAYHLIRMRKAAS